MSQHDLHITAVNMNFKVEYSTHKSQIILQACLSRAVSVMGAKNSYDQYRKHKTSHDQCIRFTTIAKSE